MNVPIEGDGVSVLTATVVDVEYLTGYNVGLCTGLCNLLISRRVLGGNQVKKGDRIVLVAKRIPSVYDSPLNSGHSYQGYYSVDGIKRLLVNPTPEESLSAMQGVFV